MQDVSDHEHGFEMGEGWLSEQNSDPVNSFHFRMQQKTRK